MPPRAEKNPPPVSPSLISLISSASLTYLSRAQHSSVQEIRSAAQVSWKNGARGICPSFAGGPLRKGD
ncbi:hypothetical protein TNIN_329391 [Trichonephila inaurata madagascariensis]|uniref:Uncharacterized protein n=1 Tax=Trichonephila inaurata madagascariensis TaxID=2747483 RepID=A0A8X6X231_9ARAC|nr:hypothetical protein TNIN_329391 [Trichonephila inaurata madagascariensis]